MNLLITCPTSIPFTQLLRMSQTACTAITHSSEWHCNVLVQMTTLKPWASPCAGGLPTRVPEPTRRGSPSPLFARETSRHPQQEGRKHRHRVEPTDGAGTLAARGTRESLGPHLAAHPLLETQGCGAEPSHSGGCLLWLCPLFLAL